MCRGRERKVNALVGAATGSTGAQRRRANDSFHHHHRHHHLLLLLEGTCGFDNGVELLLSTKSLDDIWIFRNVKYDTGLIVRDESTNEKTIPSIHYYRSIRRSSCESSS